jgi:hypothetical protein
MWDGILPWLADREWAKPSGENFDYEIVGLRSLMWQARHLDRFIASQLDKLDWIQAANFVQEKITPDIIDKAVKNMPEEIYSISGKEIGQKLKQRVQDMDKYAVDYYEMLAEEVDVVGSNQRDYFNVIRQKDGSVQVSVSDAKSLSADINDQYIFYNRTFYSSETDEIRLFGLGGKDIFKISGKSTDSIPIRIIGGPGVEKIVDNSTGAKTFIYEKSENSVIEPGKETIRKKPSDEKLYNYNRTDFAYNTYFPLPYIAYNADKQFIAGLNLEFLIQKYSVEDYYLKHNIGAELSTAGTFFIGYETRFHHLIGKWDLLGGGYYANPNDFLFFYGIGNETVKDDSLFAQDYYKTRYKSFRFQSGFIHDFWKSSSFSALIRYDNNQSQMDTKNTILADSAYLGVGKVNLAEINLTLDLDFRDNPGLPDDGMRFVLAHQNGLILSNENSNYGKTLSYFEYYASISPFTLALRAGGGGSWGEIPFYNLFNLGQNNYLRGYRNNRFSGEGLVFLNSELRLQLFDVKSIFVPMKFGIKGFFDTGRIFQSGEDSNKWHTGYGAGIFIVPLKARYTLTLSAAFSEEESLLITFGLGSVFN